LDAKTEELNKIKKERADEEAKYQAMTELQAKIKEAENYLKEIEEMHVELQHKSITIKEMEDATDYLQTMKEELDEKKKVTDESNEDLEKQYKAKEEANLKRLLAKITRDKNPEIKELISKEEAQKESNADFTNKFREEKEKLD
jgi:septal ring factor EnvC (AmiA/AmiB activator)